MKFKIRPSKSSFYPICGFTIKGASLYQWLIEIQLMNIELEDIKLFPLPGETPNSIWGYFVKFNVPNKQINTNQHELVQAVDDIFFFPQYTEFSPKLSSTDIRELIQARALFYHPETGFVELDDELNISDYISAPKELKVKVLEPIRTDEIPYKIKRYSLLALNEDETIQNFENQFPEKESLPNKPLTIWDKIKLFFYRYILSRIFNNYSEKTVKPANWFEKVKSKFNSVKYNLKQDHQDLEERNKKEVDKLMEMLENNPDEALKYAIPIDDTGLSRGSANAAFRFGKFRDSLSYNTRSFSGSGYSIDLGDKTEILRRKYINAANKLIEEGKHEKAAFIYIKLLNNYRDAAQILHKGGFYKESASIYLKQLKDARKAAQVYEEGNLLTNAIEIYKRINDFSKVGDLYSLLHNKVEAEKYYQLEIEKLINTSNYFNAAEIYLYKIKDKESGQSVLLNAWNRQSDSVKCLNTYFSTLNNSKLYSKKLHFIYDEIKQDKVKLNFLNVLKKQYKSNNFSSEEIRSLAYEIISELGVNKPMLLNELQYFNTNDNEVVIDISRFRINQ